MRTLRTMGLALAVMVALSNVTMAGGRARVELGQLPKQVTAGKSFDLAIQVVPESGSHDRNIEPRVTAENGGVKVTVAAAAQAQSNRYKATLKLPTTGSWKIRVDSRYCETVMKPVEIQAVAAAAKR